MRLPSTAADRSAHAWWRISAVAAVGGAALALSAGRDPLATVLALWAIVSLYGSVDHLVEPALAELLDALPPGRRPRRPAAVDLARATSLTTRQRRVLRLLACGLGDDEIAELLKVSQSTVTSDLDQILTHLEVDDPEQAIEVAHRSGFVAGPQGRQASPAA